MLISEGFFERLKVHFTSPTVRQHKKFDLQGVLVENLKEK